MTKKQKLKLGVALAVVSYGTQAVLLRPGETPALAVALGTLTLIATLVIILVIRWIAEP